LLLLLAPLVASCASHQPAAPASAANGVPGTVVQRALESLTSGQTLRWADHSSGATGAITPTRTFQVVGGRFCRQYELVYLNASGRRQSWTEVACRADDATWQRLELTG
jgi:surface antigen